MHTTSVITIYYLSVCNRSLQHLRYKTPEKKPLEDESLSCRYGCCDRRSFIGRLCDKTPTWVQEGARPTIGLRRTRRGVHGSLIDREFKLRDYLCSASRRSVSQRRGTRTPQHREYSQRSYTYPTGSYVYLTNSNKRQERARNASHRDAFLPPEDGTPITGHLLLRERRPLNLDPNPRPRDGQFKILPPGGYYLAARETCRFEIGGISLQNSRREARERPGRALFATFLSDCVSPLSCPGDFDEKDFSKVPRAPWGEGERSSNGNNNVVLYGWTMHTCCIPFTLLSGKLVLMLCVMLHGENSIIHFFIHLREGNCF